MCKLIVLISFVILIIYSSISIRITDINEVSYINVEVMGEVEHQIIRLPLGSKIDDLLKCVDFNEDVDIEAISKLEVLHNNQIIVFKKKSNQNKVSINSGSLSELSCLPGIGKSIAKKIIDYRNEYGSFISLDDLMKVSGIGNKKFENIKEYICL